MISILINVLLINQLCIVQSELVETRNFESRQTSPDHYSWMGLCTCDAELGLVDCSALGLQSVPTGFPKDTKYILLGNNDIFDVPDNAFSYLNELIELDLSLNQITDIRNGSFNGLESLEILKLTGNLLPSLNNQALEPVRSTLRHLDLSKNTISSEFKIDAENLVSLHLSSNSISSLATFDFSSLPNLEELYLDTNQISSLKVNGEDFSGLKSLKRLHLDYNFLRYVPFVSSFNSFRNSLEHLSLSRNFLLSSISNRDLPFVTTYNLSECSINVIDNQTFIGMPRVTTIDLTGNVLETISPQAFEGLRSLENLFLSDNQLLLLPYAALSPISATLRVLEVGYNSIPAIHKIPDNVNPVGLLENLQVLSLSRNPILKIDENSVFTQLKNLTKLMLSYTYLPKFPSAIANCNNLEYLEIDGSQIKSLDSLSLPSLPKLVHLSISDSENLEAIHDDVFNGKYSSLATLHMRDNDKLASVSSNAFEDTDTLTEMDLSGNSLEYGHTNWFEGKQIAALKLDGNPWRCDCDATEFQNFLASEQYIGIDSTDDVMCFYPRDLRDDLLQDTSPDDLCSSTICPDECLCYDENYILVRYSSSASIAMMDCSREHLISIPELPAGLQRLQLNDNSLEAINKTDLGNVTQLEVITVAENLISNIEEGSFTFATKLIEADFHSNRIPILDLSLWFGNNTNLRKLRFAGNFLSDLNNMPFSTFKNIEFLDLSKNGLQSLTSVSFTGLLAVERLILSDNIITTIDSKTFENLPMLSEIRLDGNRLEALAPDTFSDLENLQTLYIGDNSFATISKHFISSSSLSYINFEDGFVKKVEDFAFENAPSLRTLQLAYNSIYEIGDEAFTTKNESLAVTLDLSHNDLSKIPSGAVSKLVNVQFIDISYNPIVSLSINETKEHEKLYKLTQLYLSFTSLSDDVTDDSFLTMTPNLATALLNNCEFTRVPYKMLQQLPVIENINLDHNPITSISKAIDDSQFTSVTQFTLRFSEYLTKVNEEAFNCFPSLETLSMSGNENLQMISPNAFSNLNNLRSLELFSNGLQTPSPLWFSDFLTDSLKSVAMYDNPWVCDCGIVPYWEWLNQGSNDLNPYTLSIVCDEPVQLKGMKLEDISREKLCASSTTADVAFTSTQKSFAGEETTSGSASIHMFPGIFQITIVLMFISLIV